MRENLTFRSNVVRSSRSVLLGQDHYTHGQRHWFETRRTLQDGTAALASLLRRLPSASIGLRKNAMTDLALAEDCIAHARIFFNRKPWILDIAKPGTFALRPCRMLTALRGGLRKDGGNDLRNNAKFDDVSAASAKRKE